MAAKKISKKRVAYCPPPPEVIRLYAREVCQQLEQKIDASYNTPGMSRELASFLEVVATICAKALNRHTDSSDTQD